MIDLMEILFEKLNSMELSLSNGSARRRLFDGGVRGPLDLKWDNEGLPGVFFRGTDKGASVGTT